MLRRMEFSVRKILACGSIILFSVWRWTLRSSLGDALPAIFGFPLPFCLCDDKLRRRHDRALHKHSALEFLRILFAFAWENGIEKYCMKPGDASARAASQSSELGVTLRAACAFRYSFLQIQSFQITGKQSDKCYNVMAVIESADHCLPATKGERASEPAEDLIDAAVTLFVHTKYSCLLH